MSACKQVGHHWLDILNEKGQRVCQTCGAADTDALLEPKKCDTCGYKLDVEESIRCGRCQNCRAKIGEPKSDTTAPKPPLLGIIPMHIWAEGADLLDPNAIAIRIRDQNAAIARYEEAGRHVPISWGFELAALHRWHLDALQQRAKEKQAADLKKQTDKIAMEANRAGTIVFNEAGVPVGVLTGIAGEVVSKGMSPGFKFGQQKPNKVKGEAVADMVMRDHAARMKMGIEKYGEPVRAGDGRVGLKGAYEEALDLVVYLRKEITEQEAAKAEPVAVCVNNALRQQVAEIIRDMNVRLGEIAHKYGCAGVYQCQQSTLYVRSEVERLLCGRAKELAAQVEVPEAKSADLPANHC